MASNGEARSPLRAGCTWQSARSSFRSLVSLVVPMSAGSFANIIADRWTLAFVGHWDSEDRSHYDGASIGKMYSNITGLSLGVSAIIGLATFCSQAYGAGQGREKNPVFVRRALVLLLACFGFAFAAAALCEPILLALKQPPRVAHTSARYAQVQLLGVPFWWVSSCLNVSMATIKKTRPGLVMQVISSVAQLAVCYFFTCPKYLNMGYLGVAAGRSIGGVVSVITIVANIKLAGLAEYAWKVQPGAEKVLDAAAFKVYLKSSVPSALIIWSEWWAFEVLALLVGLSPNAEANLAAHGTMFGVIVVAYMVWTSTANAMCTLVGNKLGEERNSEIPVLLRTAFVWSLCTALLVSVGYELFKDSLARAFTTDPEVQQIIMDSSVGVVLSVPLYAQLMTFFGVLRGANYQKPGILGNFIGYWVIGLPAGAYIGLSLKWPTPLIGIWLGNVIALAIAATWVLTAVFCQIDWMSVRRVQNREALLGPRGQANQHPGAAAPTDKPTCRSPGVAEPARGA